MTCCHLQGSPGSLLQRHYLRNPSDESRTYCARNRNKREERNEEEKGKVEKERKKDRRNTFRYLLVTLLDPPDIGSKETQGKAEGTLANSP